MSNEGWTLSPPSPVELVSVMTVNNETGALLTMPECPGAMRHTDATQAVGKLAFDATAYDFVSCSGHKFYGPKGVGALFLRGAEPIEPLLRGGGQEHGVRAGTLNVPGIVGMGMAAELAHERRIHDFDHAVALRGALFAGIEPVPDCFVFSPEHASPYIVSLAFAGVQGESLVIELDRLGFAISSGAACSSGSTEPSPVLTALGLSEDLVRGAIRISFGRENTLESVESLAKNLAEAVLALRTLG